MFVVPLIERKRDGGALTPAEWRELIASYTAGGVPDYQMSALLMAVLWRGLEPAELGALTDAMLTSGDRLSFDRWSVPRIDKHSTGGVGDKVSLVLAPLVAACGVAVPMMSGRGLGHTGGTLDKLEAIPGFRVNLSLDEMKAALARVGCAMIGQTAQIAPADKKLYALRDVTGTVESIPLISASIMSKKIAEGIDALVLDVKTGSGAFMKTEEDSRRLAESLVSIGNKSGVRTEAVITAMDAPLGHAVGNALEVIECVDVLKGGGPSDLVDVSIELTALSQETFALALGAGLEKLRQIIETQGGDPRVVDDYNRLPRAAERHMVVADRGGRVNRVDAQLVGRASVALGAGRDRVEDAVDHAVGIVVKVKPGDEVRTGDPLLEMHYRTRQTLDAALALTARAVTVRDERPKIGPLIVAEVR